MLQQLKNIIERQWSDCTVSLSLHPNLAIKPIRFLTLNWVICVCFFFFCNLKTFALSHQAPIVVRSTKTQSISAQESILPVCVCALVCVHSGIDEVHAISSRARARACICLPLEDCFICCLVINWECEIKSYPCTQPPMLIPPGGCCSVWGDFFFVSIYKPRQRKKISPKRKSLRAAPSGKINAAALSIQLLPERWKLGW